MHRGLASVLACLSIGCGPVVLPGDGDGAGSAGSGDATSSAPTTAITATTTVPTATTGTTTAATTGDEADDDVLDDEGIGWDCGAAPPGTKHHCIAPATCDVPVRDVVAWISVDDGATPPEPVREPYVYDCTITDWSESGTLLSLALDCADGPHTLDVVASTGIWFDQAGDFTLSVIHSGATFEGGDQIVTLRRADGELVLAGASTPWRPEAAGIPFDFFDPLVVSLVDDICPIEAPPEGEPCYAVERQALRFLTELDVVEVYDHGAEQLPPWVLLVQHAEERHDVTCSDISNTWYSWVAVPPVLD